MLPSRLLAWLFILSGLCAHAQRDSACLYLPAHQQAECLEAREKGFLKGQEKIAIRKGDQLTIKLLSGKKIIYNNVAFDTTLQNYDSVKTYIFFQNIKNQWAVVKRVDRDGNTYELINLATGDKTDMDGLPVFSPNMVRVMSISGRFHGAFTAEQVMVYLIKGTKLIRSYKHEPKALESYGVGKWTSDTRIVLKKYNWETVTDGKPAESEVILLYEFGDWRKIGK
jgi:hypothetical protein